MKANAEEKEVVAPALNMTSQQMFWVGFGQTWCTVAGWYENYENLGDLIDWHTAIGVLIIVFWLFLSNNFRTSMLLLRGE